MDATLLDSQGHVPKLQTMFTTSVPMVAPTAPVLLACALALAIVAALVVAYGLARAGYPLPVGARHGQIDGLRGLLALCVIGHHFTIMQAVQQGQPWAAPTSAFAEMLGKAPVGLFFMITAFLFQPMARQRPQVAQWRAFVVRRVWRIVPLQAVSIGWVIALALTEGGKPTAIDVVRVVAWLAGKQSDLFGLASSANTFNAGVLWTLFYEWIFYLLILPVCAVLAPLSAKLPLAAQPILVMIIGLAGQGTGLTIFQWLPLFGAGMAVRILLDQPGVTPWMASRMARTISLAALVIVAIALPDPRSVHGLCLYAWLLAATASGQTRGSLLAHPATRVLGELSFGVYLLHGIVLHMAFTLVPGAGQAPLLTIPAVALATTLISAALALTVERPAIRLGRWMTRS